MMSFGLERNNMLNGREISDKLKEINKTGVLQCTDEELTEYLNYGILIESNNKYITRTGKSVQLDILKPKNYKLNLDLSNLIYQCEEIASKENIKRIYCMTMDTYNKYKNDKYIITKSDKDYYRLFENELWRVVII